MCASRHVKNGRGSYDGLSGGRYSELRPRRKWEALATMTPKLDGGTCPRLKVVVLCGSVEARAAGMEFCDYWSTPDLIMASFCAVLYVCDKSTNTRSRGPGRQTAHFLTTANMPRISRMNNDACFALSPSRVPFIYTQGRMPSHAVEALRLQTGPLASRI